MIPQTFQDEVDKYSVLIVEGRGSAERQEDAVLAFPPVFGVLDGVSNVYTPDIGPALIDGRSTGQVPRDVALKLLPKLINQGKHSLKELFLAVNTGIARRFAQAGLCTKHPDEIGGACFAVASIGPKTVEILQGADSFALWKLKDGTSGATPNQLYQADWVEDQIVAWLLKQHNGNRSKMWKTYSPNFFAPRVRKFANGPGGYALLNGSPEVAKYWNSFSLPRRNLQTLLLFTDGLVPREQTASPELLVSWTLERYRKGGIQKIRKAAWELEEAHKTETYIDHPEYSMVAIEFLQT